MGRFFELGAPVERGTREKERKGEKVTEKAERAEETRENREKTGRGEVGGREESWERDRTHTPPQKGGRLGLLKTTGADVAFLRCANVSLPLRAPPSHPLVTSLPPSLFSSGPPGRVESKTSRAGLFTGLIVSPRLFNPDANAHRNAGTKAKTERSEQVIASNTGAIYSPLSASFCGNS